MWASGFRAKGGWVKGEGWVGKGWVWVSGFRAKGGWVKGEGWLGE